MSFLLGTLLHSIQESVLKLFIRFRVFFYKLSVFFLTSTVLLWLSVFLYASFYYTYMPAISHVKPVHFQFQSCSDAGDPCNYPSANVTLIKKGYEQLLMRGQQYRVFLDLEMPESPRNQELGMFMVRIDFRSRNGEIIQSSARSAMLHYKSSLLSIMHTLFFSPFLLMGSTEEKQIIKIELFDYYEEDPRNPSVNAGLEIQSRNIQIYTATLRIFAHFTGIRYLMFHWPIISAVIGVGSNLFFLTTIALLSWYRYVVTQKNTHVVVRVGIDDKSRGIEERRLQAKEFLLRQRERQSSLREGDGTRRSRSQSPSPGKLDRRTYSLERLTPSKVRYIETLGSEPKKSNLETKDESTKTLEQEEKDVAEKKDD